VVTDNIYKTTDEIKPVIKPQVICGELNEINPMIKPQVIDRELNDEIKQEIKSQVICGELNDEINPVIKSQIIKPVHKVQLIDEAPQFEQKINGFKPPRRIASNENMKRKIMDDVDRNESNKRRIVAANVDNNTNGNNNNGFQNFVSFGKNIYPQQVVIPYNKKKNCHELIQSSITQGLSFLAFSVAVYYYNKNFNQNKLDTRVLLAELLIELNFNNNDNNNKKNGKKWNIIEICQ